MDILKEKLWLVKVPEVIYNEILGTREIGHMDIFESNENKKEITINLGDYDDQVKFDVQYEKTENFFCFQDKKNKIKKVNYLGRFIAKEEWVSDRVTINVARDELTNKPSIAIEYGKGRPITNSIVEISKHQYYATTNDHHKAINQKNRKEKHLKKTRMDIEELKNQIFILFGEKDYWTNKELVAKLDQPENYLKQVLTEMCELIRTGPKKGCYELKRHFIKSKMSNKEDEELSDENF